MRRASELERSVNGSRRGPACIGPDLPVETPEAGSNRMQRNSPGHTIQALDFLQECIREI